MKEITLYGAGGHSWAVVELIRSLDAFVPVAIVDDNPVCDEILKVPVYKTAAFTLTTDVCITIGNNRDRKKIVTLLTATYPNFVHRSAQLYPSVKMGKGVQVFPGVVLDAAAALGDFVIINNNVTIAHNTAVGNFAHVAINAAVAGDVQIGEGCLVGAGSVILPGVKLGAWSVVGAGAVVTKDVPENAIVVGNPAQIIKYTH